MTDWEAFRVRLLVEFEQELRAHIAALQGDVLALERAGAAGARKELVRSMFRTVHTIKGSSRAVHVASVEALAHAGETVLDRVQDDEAVGPETVALLLRLADALDAALELLHQTGEVPEDHGRELIAAMSSLAEGEPQRPSGTSEEPTASMPENASSLGRRPQLGVRMTTETLDSVQGTASILARRLGARRSTTALLAPLRALVEGAAQGGLALARALDRVESELQAERRDDETLARVFEGDVRRLRLAPLSQATARLPRAARDLAVALGKQVEVFLEAEVELDRGVVEPLADPLLHLVRNAVDHGIEKPNVRSALGKAPVGTIRVRGVLDGDWARIEVEDDGAGIDVERVRDALRARGERADLDAQAILRRVLLSGVSTSVLVTDVSGRGVGLDVVNAAITGLGGRVEIASQAGKGTRIALIVPSDVGVMPALVIERDESALAVPLAGITRIDPHDPLRIVDVGGVRSWPSEQHGPVPLASLDSVLGIGGTPRAMEAGSVIVLRSDPPAAVLVAGGLSTEDLVVRALPEALQVPPLRSAGARSNGSLALILDVDGLARAAHVRSTDAKSDEVVEPVRRTARVLLVDDAIVTRNLECAILEDAGYVVVTAEDGESAWSLLVADRFDAVVTDVEMPRLDGIGLTERIRSDERTRHLPVVLVTSRDAEADRARGLSAGADAYVAKAGFDERELLDALARLT